jgi:group I intron endonuclease
MNTSLPSLPTTGGIYKIINTVTNNFYIGQSTNLQKRKIYHDGDLRNNKYKNPHLQNSWNKHGEDSFSFEILLQCEFWELDRYEQWFVDNLNPEYNIMTLCVTKPKGLKLSEEHKRKLSLAHMGKPGFWKGKCFSDDHRRKLSEWQKGKPKPRKKKEDV